MTAGNSGNVLEIVNVAARNLPPEALRGFSLDLPREGDQFSNHEFSVAGWALGQRSRAVAIEFSTENTVFQRIPLTSFRTDVSSSISDGEESSACGFVGCLALIPSPETSIGVAVVLQDQSRVPAATILVRTSSSPASGASAAVSVVIPCYRQAHLLRDAIGGVLRQSHRSIEIIVVDDGSPDNTEEVVRRFPGVRYVRQENRGLAGARNTGLALAGGEFLIFLDADDRLLPGAIEAALAEFARNPGNGFVAGHFRFIGLDGIVVASPTPRTPTADYYAGLLSDYSVGPPGAVMFRREVFDRVGLFDPSISPAADYDMVMRVAAKYPVVAHSEAVLEYRLHGANMTSDPAEMLRTTMRALGHQWLVSRRSARLRKAYREGRRHWRESWGDLLVEKALSDIAAHRYRSLPRELGILLRWYPAGLRKVVRGWNRSERPLPAQ